VAAENDRPRHALGSHYFYVGSMFDRARQARFQVEDLREVAVVTGTGTSRLSQTSRRACLVCASLMNRINRLRTGSRLPGAY
jgi:hypothetical protein